MATDNQVPPDVEVMHESDTLLYQPCSGDDTGQSVNMDSMVQETKPLKTLQELYEAVETLRDGYETKELRESTEYVFLGSEVSSGKLELQRLDRDNIPRTLVCHDMKGGYLEDRFINGSKLHDSYLFYNWSIVDTFVYFSHHFITIPPYGWINAAHDHGVRILGTVITEQKGIWEVILFSQESVEKFADALVTIATFYKFDGWLLNVESEIEKDDIENMIYFIKYLTETMHSRVTNSEIIWYDSIKNDGTLKWQNELNDSNKEFFLNCDGIYLNYNWTEQRLSNSRNLAKEYDRDIRDIYVGLDVWGRGCPGGGGFNSAYALEKIREQDLSVAIFAPGWTHEFFGPGTFEELENLFWAQLHPHLYIHVPIYENEVFKTSFCRGNGKSFYRSGEIQLEMLVSEGNAKFEESPFYNLSLQKPQISVPIPHLKFIRVTEIFDEEVNQAENSESKKLKKLKECVYETKRSVIRVRGKIVDFESKLPPPYVNSFEFCNRFSYEGGGCLKLITKDPRLYHRLFLVHIEFPQDIQGSIVFEVPEASTETSTRNEPILILGNYLAKKSIRAYRSERLNSRWRKCFYLTNMQTVNEIGITFAEECVCYVGEIVLEQKVQQPV